MASDGMVQELERLRKLLDVDPADQLRKHDSGAMSVSDAAYAGALHAAEVCRKPAGLVLHIMCAHSKCCVQAGHC